VHDNKEQLIQTLYAQIGELKVANDFLKKGVVKPLSERRLLIEPEHKNLFKISGGKRRFITG
jgi:hypothetical protein